MKNIKSGYNLILKPRRGSLGKNVYKLAKEENEFRLYYQTIYPKSIFKSDKELIEYVNEIVWSKKRFIIQPFISFAKVGERVFDMRLFVQKNGEGVWDVTESASRVGYTNRYITNVACPTDW